MNDKISTIHRMFLWLCVVYSFIFGFTYYLQPISASLFNGRNEPDLIANFTIGGFLIAAFVGAVLSLQSGSWIEVRIITYGLIIWSLLNGLRMTWIIFSYHETRLIMNTVFCLVIGIGLTYEAVRRSSFFSKSENDLPATKRNRSRAVYFITIILVMMMFGGFLLFVYFLENGNPVSKYRSQEIVSEYLESKYPNKSFKVDHVGYYPGYGFYIVHFMTKDGKIEGNISVSKGKIDEEGIELFNEHGEEPTSDELNF